MKIKTKTIDCKKQHIIFSDISGEKHSEYDSREDAEKAMETLDKEFRLLTISPGTKKIELKLIESN